MSLHDYQQSKTIDSTQWEFYALIMAAMRQADDYNLRKLNEMWPDVYSELKGRYNAPGGILESDDFIPCSVELHDYQNEAIKESVPDTNDSPVDIVAKEIAELINNDNLDKALKMWKKEIKDLRFYEAIILKDKVNSMVNLK